MIRKLTIIGILLSMAACLRAAAGQSDLDIQIAIAIAESEAAQSVPPPSGQATRPVATKAPLGVVDLPADSQPTPMSIVVEGLQLLELKPSDTFADIGCGFDCRWGITAAKRYGCRVVAIERDPELATSANRYVNHAGLAHLITVYAGDAAKVKFTANKGAAYLWESDLAALKSKIQKFDKFVSFAHRVPGLRMRPVGSIYVYEKPKPKPQLVAQVVTPTAAVYRGRQYSGPVCGNPRCSMCAAIRSQLQPRVRYVEKPTASAQPAGRWVKVKTGCVNGVCRFKNVWQAY